MNVYKKCLSLFYNYNFFFFCKTTDVSKSLYGGWGVSERPEIPTLKPTAVCTRSVFGRDGSAPRPRNGDEKTDFFFSQNFTLGCPRTPGHRAFVDNSLVLREFSSKYPVVLLSSSLFNSRVASVAVVRARKYYCVHRPCPYPPVGALFVQWPTRGEGAGTRHWFCFWKTCRERGRVVGGTTKFHSINAPLSTRPADLLYDYNIFWLSCKLTEMTRYLTCYVTTYF